MGRQRGMSGSVQAVILLPVALGIFLLLVQWSMLAWADAVGAVLGPRKAGAAAALLTQLSLASERYWERREATA